MSKSPEPPIPCNGARAGVIVVHGVGSQTPGETLEAYGGAIAKVWSEFGESGGRSSRVCDRGHVHLLDATGGDAALVSEAYWADVITQTPSTPKVLWWVLVSAPWLLLYSLARFPRKGLDLIWLACWPLWFFRVLFSPILLVGFQLLLLSVLVLRLPLRRMGLRFLEGPIEMIVGDSYLFVMNEAMRAASAERVASVAASIAPNVDRIIVIAHSQGAAVTAEAVRHEAWPKDEPAHLVSVGSGFLRLRTLRKIGTGAVGVIGGLLVTIAASFVTYLSFLFPSPIHPDFNSRDQLLFGALAMFWIVGLVLLLRARRAAVAEADEVVGSKIITTWTDMWSTHDLVPDGPIKAKSAKVHRVENARSMIRDHTTYHRNPLEVLVPIVALIEPDRFADDGACLKRLRMRRYARLWIRRWLDAVIFIALLLALFDDTLDGRQYARAYLAGFLVVAWLWGLWHNRRADFEFLGDTRWLALRPQRSGAKE